MKFLISVVRSLLVLCLLDQTLQPTKAASDDDDSDKVQFYLYNDPENSELSQGHKLDLDDPDTISSSKLRSKVPIKIMIHGFVHNYSCWYPQQLKDLYFSHNLNYSIIAVDWGPLASPPGDFPKTYEEAVASMELVGKKIANLIAHLHKRRMLNLKTLHVVGFSLGAHVAGYAGYEFNKKRLGKIGRITGLDPAGPGFEPTSDGSRTGRRLDKCDGQFVDVIYTGMGEYGINTTIGHANFFVNGGKPDQPGCKNVDASIRPSCNHAAAPNYFMQSFGRKDLRACPCTARKYRAGKCNMDPDDCDSTLFGDSAKSGTKGNFYLDIQKLITYDPKYNC